MSSPPVFHCARDGLRNPIFAGGFRDGLDDGPSEEAGAAVGTRLGLVASPGLFQPQLLIQVTWHPWGQWQERGDIWVTLLVTRAAGTLASSSSSSHISNPFPFFGTGEVCQVMPVDRAG